jgi:hypothetical protein
VRRALGALGALAPTAAERCGWAAGGAVALAYLILHPATPDLAAQAFRAELFAHHGFVLYDSAWYAGHHALGYSLLAPSLAALLGPRVAAALATVVAVGLFARLLVVAGRPRMVPVLWFALTAGANLFIGRLPFALGMALGIGALLALRARPAVAAALGAGCALASPVAGLLLLIPLLAWALTARRMSALAVAAATLASVVALELAFPEGGTFFYPASVLRSVLVFCAVLAVAAPAGSGAVRVGAALYALAALVAWVVPSPMGENIDRLGTVLGGPIFAAALLPRRRLLVVAAVPVLLWWAAQPVRYDFPLANGPSASAGYYRGLIGFLTRHDLPPARVEIPFTRGHWETAFVAPHVALARGWERQLDLRYAHLFYEPGLTPERYHRWLRRLAVRYVALPDVRLDFSSRREAALIRRGLPFLREVWHDRHWRVYVVSGADPVVSAPGVLQAMGPDWFRVRIPGPATVVARLHFTPYWTLAHGAGCLRETPAGWTALTVPRGGEFTVATRLRPAGVLAAKRIGRCPAGPVGTGARPRP